MFVLGGARSGKSRYAQERAEQAAGPGGRVLFIATAEARDEEMRERVRRHRLARPGHWTTVEAPRLAARAVADAAPGTGAVLVDCLTLLMTNLLLEPLDLSDAGAAEADAGAAEAEVLAEIERLLAAARAAPAPVILVSNEVGLGVVPPSELGRAFRDIAGRAHQRVAAEADEVVFLVAGIPQRIKG